MIPCEQQACMHVQFHLRKWSRKRTPAHSPLAQPGSDIRHGGPWYIDFKINFENCKWRKLSMFGMWHFMAMASLMHPILFFIYIFKVYSQQDSPTHTHTRPPGPWAIQNRDMEAAGEHICVHASALAQATGTCMHISFAWVECTLTLHKWRCTRACPPFARYHLLSSPAGLQSRKGEELWSTELTVLCTPPGFVLAFPLFGWSWSWTEHSFQYILLYQPDHF